MKIRLLIPTVLLSTRWNHFAFAGLATFSPASQDVTPGTIATMDITLTTQQLAEFDSVDAIPYGPGAFPWSWTYSKQFREAATSLLDPNNELPFCDPFPCPILVGGATTVSGGFGHSIILGTLHIDTAGFPSGDYDYVIDSNRDGGISQIAHLGNAEPLFGQGVIHVVPEPSCVRVLSLGAIVVFFKGRAMR